jgi:hypothetical protein
MRTLLLLTVATAIAFAADDGGWAKLRDLRGGTELKIWQHGSEQPLSAKFSDATDDKLLVVVKKEEIAIPKARIERVDYKPSGKSKPTVSKTTKVSEPGVPDVTKSPDPVGGPSHPASGEPEYSSSTSVAFGGGPGFETIYRRTTPPAAK